MLEFVPFSTITPAEWDAFCAASQTAWFRHTSWFRRYTTETFFNQEAVDISFAVRDDGRLVALVPLLIQPIFGHAGLTEFAMGGTPTPYPAFVRLSLHDEVKLSKIIFQEIDRLAQEHRVAVARFFVDPLSDTAITARQLYNPLLKFGFHSTELTTNILSLAGDEAILLSGMARGHRTDIIFASKQGYITETFDATTISSELFAAYRALHLRAAGRQTRPDSSWESMLAWVRHGHAILSLIRTAKSPEYLSGMLVIMYNRKAYYGSGATDPDHEKIRGLGHLLQWETMKYLQRHGVTHYETGWNAYPIISEDVASKKEINIAHFKSLFGGEVRPLFRGEKYYDIDFLRLRRQTLTEKFITLQTQYLN